MIDLVIVGEMPQLTQRVGFNLFVLQGMTEHNILYIARDALRFFFLMMLGVVLISLFPGIVTWLPQVMNN